MRFPRKNPAIPGQTLKLLLAPIAALALVAAGNVTLVNVVSNAKTEIATFAGGCFWTMERAFDGVPGVVTAVSGYTGGKVPNPSYEDVSSDTTGHAESVEVRYDPARISYPRLLDIYWHHIDPTQLNSQACDTGTQYRSEIFFHNATQQKQAQAYKDSLQRSGLFKQQPIVVQMAPAGAFYAAEEYHQDYARKNPEAYDRYRIGCGRDRRLQAIWGTAANR